MASTLRAACTNLFDNTKNFIADCKQAPGASLGKTIKTTAQIIILGATTATAGYLVLATAASVHTVAKECLPSIAEHLPSFVSASFGLSGCGHTALLAAGFAITTQATGASAVRQLQALGTKFFSAKPKTE